MGRSEQRMEACSKAMGACRGSPLLNEAKLGGLCLASLWDGEERGPAEPEQGQIQPCSLTLRAARSAPALTASAHGAVPYCGSRVLWPAGVGKCDVGTEERQGGFCLSCASAEQEHLLATTVPTARLTCRCSTGWQQYDHDDGKSSLLCHGLGASCPGPGSSLPCCTGRPRSRAPPPRAVEPPLPLPSPAQSAHTTAWRRPDSSGN